MYNSNEYIQMKTKNIVPSMRYDESKDLAEWQKKGREKLSELLGMDQFERCEDKFAIVSKKQCEGYQHIEFTFQSEEGYYVMGDLLVPEGITGPLPAAICLQGHSRGKHISLGIVKYEKDVASIAGGRDFAVRAVKEGFCAIALEQRYMGEAGGKEDGCPACVGRINEGMPALLLGRTNIGERVWDTMRLIDVMEKYMTQYVDLDRIILMGNSGGGTATFYAACLEKRIYLAMPSCAVCTFEDSIMAMHHCPCNYVPGIRRYFDMGDMGGMIAPRRYVQVSGMEDTIFPLHGAQKSYELIREVYKQFGKEELCRLVKGNGGHQFYPDEAWPVVHELLKE